jgi:hypothetical protein
MISKEMRTGNQSLPRNVFSDEALRRIAGSVRPTVISNVRDVSVSFPNASIASDMDLVMIDSRVRRVVKDEMRRR